jgi:antirestriction protein ArdC
MATTYPQRDIYAEVTDRIIAQLEAGTAPWARPWSSIKGANVGGLPVNYATGRAYRGINVFMLWASGFDDQRWLTYKQAQAIGAHVRKGEKGSLVVFFKPFAITDKNDPESKEKTIPVMKSFTVFNVAQIDGLPEDVAPVAPAPITYTRAAEMQALATITHGGDRAYYSRGSDAIRLPHLAQFASEADYHATALHELTHWTGHASRCAREFGKRFGDDAYAVEELCAEMGAAFLCASAGIEYQAQHASYLASWLKVLKADKKAIVHAASKAQAAADFVLAAIGKADAEDDESVLAA